MYQVLACKRSVSIDQLELVQILRLIYLMSLTVRQYHYIFLKSAPVFSDNIPILQIIGRIRKVESNQILEWNITSNKQNYDFVKIHFNVNLNLVDSLFSILPRHPPPKIMMILNWLPNNQMYWIKQLWIFIRKCRPKCIKKSKSPNSKSRHAKSQEPMNLVPGHIKRKIRTFFIY